LTHYVYLIMSETGDCKIGRTGSDPAKRLKQLQTASSEKLTLVCYFKTSNMKMLETMLHTQFGTKRKLGEWFALDEEEVAGFIESCERNEKIILALKENSYIRKRYKQ
jgi:hypothetical protein